MKTKFVTCIYNGLYRTDMGGRLNRDWPYKYSLGAIARSGIDLICYTSPEEFEELEKYFLEVEEVDNIEFRAAPLDAMYFHEGVMQIRRSVEKYNTLNEWKQRSVHIMWGKFIFLKQVISEPHNLDNIFWIDAGISHGGIIHSRFNPHYDHNEKFVRDLDKSTYHLTFRNELIFNSEFENNLVNYTGNEYLLNIKCTHPQHRLIPNIPYKTRGSVIGGIFGGNIEFVDVYCDKVIELFEYYLSKGELWTEEHLMTILASTDDMVPLKTYEFDTWYHPDWMEQYNEKQSSFCNFFDEIAKK